MALILGGVPAAILLSSKEYGQLLKGFGSAEERKKLSSSWLARLRIPHDAELEDLEKLGCTKFRPILYDARAQVPVFLGEGEREARGNGPWLLRDLVAALCSIVPIEVGPLSLLDAESVVPMECLAGSLNPRPFLVMGPLEPSLKGSRAVEYSAMLASFMDRMLSTRCCDVPVFRVRVPHTLQTLLQSGSHQIQRSLPRRAVTAAGIFSYIAACILVSQCLLLPPIRTQAWRRQEPLQEAPLLSPPLSW